MTKIDGSFPSSYRSFTFPDTVTEFSWFKNIIISCYIAHDKDPESWGESRGCGINNCQLNYDGHYPHVYSFVFPRTISTPIMPPYRKGYEFLGWTTVEGSMDPEYETYQLSFPPYETVIFPYDAHQIIPEGTVMYAIWKPVEK